MAPGINGWGCENSPPTKFVQSVGTDANGVITATATNDAELYGAVGITLVLTPYISGAVATIAAIPDTITEFRCTTNNKKYAPGPCKN